MKTLSVQANVHRKDTTRSVLMATILLVGCFLTSAMAHSHEVSIVKDSQSAKAVIDFRTGNPKLALIYLTLIGDTFRDRNLQTATSHPDFVVNFGGESVKLMAKDAKGYPPEAQKTISQIKETVSALARQGIRFEYCTYGARLFGVEPENVPGMTVVDNGWDSLIGYQTRGYSLVPAY